jgi:hypothetical protein
MIKGVCTFHFDDGLSIRDADGAVYVGKAWIQADSDGSVSVRIFPLALNQERRGKYQIALVEGDTSEAHLVLEAPDSNAPSPSATYGRFQLKPERPEDRETLLRILQYAVSRLT